MLYRHAVSELLAVNPERWNAKLAKPYDMRVVFTWLYVCMTTDVNVTLKQTKYKLNAMGKLQGYGGLSASLDVDFLPSSTPTFIPYHPPSATSHHEEFRLQYLVVKCSNHKPSLRPIGDAIPSGMLPPSTYSVCMVGDEIPGAQICIQSPWTFSSDCKVVVDGGTALSLNPLYVEARPTGDSLSRMTECILPSDVLAQVSTCPHRESVFSALRRGVLNLWQRSR